MSHDTPLITTLVLGLGVAFILGAIANRLRVSPLVGYLLAGVLIGPATPGLVADQKLAPELAEIGVILLMFGVGLHFSVKELLSVRRIAVPGAIGQLVIATLMGMGLSWALGWSIAAGLVFGLALSVASTVVLLRALQERRLIESDQGRIAVGWLIVEDLAMVLALVLLPTVAGFASGGGAGIDTEAVLRDVGMTLGLVAIFVALMFVVGRRVIPWILHTVAHSGSRELFRLAVLAIALGIAYGAAKLFGVSLALGAFFAGMILSESALSQRAAEETLPFRDAFAVLFFVSVGMLFDPAILVQQPVAVFVTAVIIIFGKSIVAFLIVRAFGHPNRVALTISASLAQVGEFSFILAALGLDLGLISQEAQDLVLAGAIISILVNPMLFDLLDRWRRKHDPSAEAAGPVEPEGLAPTALGDHAVVVGFGRVGSAIGETLEKRGVPYVVIEDSGKVAEGLRSRGVEVFAGNAVEGSVLDAAGVARARWLFVAIPNAFEAGHMVRAARTANHGLVIVARAHFDEEVDYLKSHGANEVIMGEREIARGMVDYVSGEAAPEPAPG
jgi:CPA2 family monovalent cation:H+ antiporter-2